MTIPNHEKIDYEDQPSKVTEAYERELAKFKRRREAFMQEFRAALNDAIGEEKNALAQIMEVVDNDGKATKSRNAYETFLFGENSEQIMQKQLSELQNYMESAKAIKERYADDEEGQKSALFLLAQNKEQIMGISDGAKSENSDGFVGDMVDGMSTTLSNGLGKMLTDFDNFDANLENLGKSLANKMIKTSVDALMQMIFNEQSAAAAILAIRASYGAVKGMALGAMNFFTGGVAGAVGGFDLGGIAMCHSGGIIPEGANVNLPGTKEQLALLKGGERILSPGENVEYEKTAQQSPIVYNNFNIKAWDSKDVQKYLLENKQLLHAITFEGIKNNNNHLRTIVRNA